MSQSRSAINAFGQKLNVERKVTVKATELSDLLEARAGSATMSALRLSGSCSHIACLDLAAKIFGCTLNKDDVIKLSGMNKKTYGEAVRVIASMLDLEERLTVRELAVQFGCTGAVGLATDTLHRYILGQCGDIDFGAPMFLCAALIVACRKLKLKIDVGKLKEHSGVKKGTLDRLIVEMDKYVTVETACKQKSSQPMGGILETVAAYIEEDNDKAKKHKLEEDEGCDERKYKTSEADYEEWKRKILAKAARNG